MGYKSSDKVCCICAEVLDKENAKLPWFSEQIRAKNKWIAELLQEIENLQKPIDRDLEDL